MSEPRPSPPREPPAAQAPAPDAPSSAAGAARKALLAPAELPSRLTYVAVAGPSGVKQCFRSVKTVRRIPTLPKKIPKDSDSEPSIETGTRARRSSSKKHECTTCKKTFSTPGKLQQHMLSHTGELPFTCELCDKRFNSKFKLARHSLVHSETRDFSCPVCSKTFNRKDHLNNHVRVHNPVKKVHRCERPGCRKQYTSLLSFRKHSALHSAEEGNLQCKICSKTFPDRDAIVHHLKVHTGSRSVKSETDKKFPCAFCDRRFFTGKDVRRHLVVHTGRRDFLCQFCPQKFGRKDHLVRHVKNAHPDEPYTSIPSTSSAPLKIEQKEKSVPYLDYLEQLFPDERSSSSVMSTPVTDDIALEAKPEQPESGRKFHNFMCQFCPHKFEHKDHLVQHLKNVHSDQAFPIQSTSKFQLKAEPREVPYLDYLNELFPDECSSSSVASIPDDISVKLEPCETTLTDTGLSFDRELSPQPGPSREVLQYPMYILPPPQYPLLDIEPDLLLESSEEREVEECLSSDIMDLIHPGRMHVSEQQTTLPTFTKAFQSTAPSRKLPPAPPQ